MASLIQQRMAAQDAKILAKIRKANEAGRLHTFSGAFSFPSISDYNTEDRLVKNGLAVFVPAKDHMVGGTMVKGWRKWLDRSYGGVHKLMWDPRSGKVVKKFSLKRAQLG